MTDLDPTIVRRQIVVEAPIEHAFTVFTDRFGDFKPAEHNLMASPITETVLEPRVGGHIFDRAVDGSECHWARVLAFEPPDRVVFSWDISPTGRSKPTRNTPARSRSASWPKLTNAPAWNWSIATSTATAQAGKASATALTTTPAGRSISPATPSCSSATDVVSSTV